MWCGWEGFDACFKSILPCSHYLDVSLDVVPHRLGVGRVFDVCLDVASPLIGGHICVLFTFDGCVHGCSSALGLGDMSGQLTPHPDPGPCSKVCKCRQGGGESELQVLARRQNASQS